MHLPTDLQYTVEHEWIRRMEGNRVRIGITDFAQSELGDIIFVELPGLGDQVDRGTPLGSVESVKTVSELYSPVTGKVVAVNGALASAPGTVNEDAYGKGWLVEVELPGPLGDHDGDSLLDAASYRKHVTGA
nr:glycine cleavage system protein GcvH [Pasteuria penetrans]